MISLAGCGDQGGDPTAQIGPKPNLPELQQFLIPQMHVAKIVGWKQDEKPAVAQGLKIEALATGLQHPRSVCVLPNGDVLVVESKAAGTEPVTRPKSIVMHWVEWMATSGAQDVVTGFLNDDNQAHGRPAVLRSTSQARC